MKKHICMFGVILLLFPASAAAQLSVNAGKIAVTWLKIGVGGRGAAMAESCSVISDDAGAMFSNPARLALVEKPQLIAQYGAWFAGTGYHAIGYAKPIADREGGFKNILGIGLTYFDSGQMRFTENINDAVKLDTELTSEDWFSLKGMAFLVSYGQKFGGAISAGYTVKIIAETIRDSGSMAVAFDAGGVISIDSGGKFTLGAVAQNIGTKFEDKDLPQNIKLGLGMHLNRLTVGVDCNVPNDHSVKTSAGLEFKVNSVLALRCGYLFAAAGEEGLQMPGFSAGIGLVSDNLCVDLGFVPYGALGDTCRTSITLKF